MTLTLNDIPSSSLDVTRWADPAFWRAIAPDLHVVDPQLAQQAHRLNIDEASARQLEALLCIEGYFQLGPQNYGTPVEKMANTVRALVAKGLPPAFAFVYDEFWMTYISLNAVLAGLLGADYRALPDFWVWHVDPKKAESGWTPHRDKSSAVLFDDNRPKSLTVWIPLTEATPLNGCIYMLPMDRDPLLRTPDERDWNGKIPYGDVRALPAMPGSFLCWNQAVLHWGGHASPRAPDARISMAFEFQRGDVEPMNQPLLDPLSFFDLAARLRLIAKQILQYKHMYPLSAEINAAAERLIRS